MVGISAAYDEEAARLEAAIRHRTFKLFDIYVLRSIDCIPVAEDWDDSQFIVRTQRGSQRLSFAVSRLMLRSLRIDAPLDVARMLADAYRKYDRKHDNTSTNADESHSQ